MGQARGESARVRAMALVQLAMATSIPLSVGSIEQWPRLSGFVNGLAIVIGKALLGRMKLLWVKSEAKGIQKAKARRRCSSVSPLQRQLTHFLDPATGSILTGLRGSQKWPALVNLQMCSLVSSVFWLHGSYLPGATMFGLTALSMLLAKQLHKGHENRLLDSCLGCIGGNSSSSRRVPVIPCAHARRNDGWIGA